MSIYDKFIVEMDMGIASDGRSFSMRFQTTGGEEVEVCSDIENMQQLVSNLLQATQEAGNLMSDEDRANLLPSPGIEVGTYPIDAVDVNVAHGRSQEEFILSVQLGSIRLTFALPELKAQSLMGKLSKL